eukprot:TRINITY_DN45028_c0_g1_i1.p1 TRINITY_DN45028_c0_g1~~TRINITY_DN45028_c0_g1_i1.p1  ORF type:complete len:224 (-),score=32.62 TRINITY_DN45028_c0_g1_i1:12-683(-)
MLKASGVNLHLNTKVTSVAFDSANETYTLEYCSAGACANAMADYVILACPVEHSDIAFTPAISAPPRQWRHWYVTVTRAHGLNPEFFGFRRGESVPYINVLTTENSSATIPFNVLQQEALLADGTSLWKFFSNEDLTSVLPDIFEGLSQDPADTVVQHWPYTFPVLKPVAIGGSSLYQPISLMPGMLHLNTLESVASAMEGSVIAARNAALLLGERRFGTVFV